MNEPLEDAFPFDLSAVLEATCEHFPTKEHKKVWATLSAEISDWDSELFTQAIAPPSVRFADRKRGLAKARAHLSKARGELRKSLEDFEWDTFEDSFRMLDDGIMASSILGQVTFAAEQRGAPDWQGRFIAVLLYQIFKKARGIPPSIGTEAGSDDPSTEYGKLLTLCLRACENNSHFRKLADYAKSNDEKRVK